MKRWIVGILLVAMSLSMLGCQEEKPVFQEPVKLYYRTVTPEDSIADPVIDALITEGAGRTDNIESLLNDYLQGTHQEGFVPTFPIGTRLVSLSTAGGVALVELSPAFADLTGMELTIACACITMTVLDLTDAHTVAIRTTGATLDGANQITMSRSSLTLLDEYTPDTTQE